MKKNAVLSVLIVVSILSAMTGCGRSAGFSESPDSFTSDSEVSESETSSVQSESAESKPTEQKEEKPYANYILTGQEPEDTPSSLLPYPEGSFTSLYDDTADEMRQSVLENPDTLKDTQPEGRFLYVSESGDDGHDGLSPETAWCSLNKVSKTARSGDVVLFERGGIYRGMLEVCSGVSYGAYGEGEKPRLYGSLHNYADPEIWESAGDNLWKCTLDRSVDAGQVIMDEGRYSAHKVFSEKSLDRNYTFYQDGIHLTMYCSLGNPGEIFTEIEIGQKWNVIGGNGSDMIFENLCVRYTGAHGFGFGSMENLVIRGCEVGYIGGSLQNDEVRYGNGIEIYGAASHVLWENNWVYQCYDAGITHQCNPAVEFDDIVIQNNLVEFCEYCIEAFNHEGTTDNTVYRDNLLRFAGYQIFDPNDRHGSSPSACACICLWAANPGENYLITGNILDTSYKFMAYAPGYTTEGMQASFSGNAYHQQGPFPSYYVEKATGIPCVTTKGASFTSCYYAMDPENMLRGVEILDPEYTACDFTETK